MTLHADFKETVFDSFSRVISLLRMECKCPNGLEQGAPQMDRGSQDLEDQTGLNLMNKQEGILLYLSQFHKMITLGGYITRT